MEALTKKLMGDKPKPTQWDRLSIGEVLKHRSLSCFWYSQCLREAALAAWEGWSCFWCPLKEEENEEREGMGESLAMRNEEAFNDLRQISLMLRKREKGYNL
jgi:hypothetical protein